MEEMRHQHEEDEAQRAKAKSEGEGEGEGDDGSEAHEEDRLIGRETGASHRHSVGCGHTMIFHEDHVGYFEDGRLLCMPDASQPSNVVVHKLPPPPQAASRSHVHEGSHGHGHSHNNGGGHGHSHNSDGGHGHSHGSDGGHGHSHNQPRAVGASVVAPAAVEAEGHVHDPQCGHERVWHDDHFDFLVGNKLQPQEQQGTCGEVRRFVARHDVLRALANPDDQMLEEFGIVASPQILRLLVTSKKSWYRDPTMRKFVMMLGMTGSYFVVELVVGLSIGSLALVSDAFHMFSDMLGLVVGFMALKLSRSSGQNNTFHYARAEVLGALVNAVFLLAVCVTITLEAVERLFEAGEHSKLEGNGLFLLGVAGVGLLMNVLGLFIFGGHGHGHSHGGGHGHSHGGGHGHSHGGESAGYEHVAEESKPKRNLNVHGVFLHILGDALGSVAAIVSGLVIWLSDSKYRTLADPLCTFGISLIIFSGTVPLIKQTIPILLDSVPKSVDMKRLKEQLSKIPGVRSLHELHVWSISPNSILASVHVGVQSQTDCNVLLVQMKMVLHAHGIHVSTIQPEFVDHHLERSGEEGQCLEPLCGSRACLHALCCVPADKDE